jgi:HSP20 family protein
MPTLIHPSTTRPQPDAATPGPPTRHPHYDCQDLPHALKLTVFVPGVDASGVDIASRGPDLVVTARKAHVVRVNWQALHLESAQLDYRLRLRLGLGFDYDALHATLADGVLVLTLPKKFPDNALSARPRRVA